MKLYISKPENFSFRNTVYSHGWSELSPFSLNEEDWTLSCVFRRVGKGKPLYADITETNKKVKIDVKVGKLARRDIDKITADAKRILRFDDNLSEFYSIADKQKGFEWISKAGVGRLVRSASVFEDLVKTICTTNCSWALTKKMVENLVVMLGVEGSDGQKAFPTAAAMAGVDEAFFRDQIRSGYRSPYFVELANAVVDGSLRPEDWLDSDLSSEELKKEMLKVKGVGNYAAENLLKLVGRYDGLALDSWLRSEFYKTHNKEKPCSDKKIENFYAKFGRWRGLAIWFDLNRRWFL